jgi:hypothetical protein
VVLLAPWKAWLAAAVATLLACVLVILDQTDAELRHWWNGHDLTTDTIAGLLVLGITGLVVDQVVRLRQIKNRSRAVTVQVAIILTQANRATQAVSQAVAGSGERDAAYEEFRTYTTMLLAVAPTLIDAQLSRNFLEHAQHLDGELALALSVLARASGHGKPSATGIDDSLRALKTASVPLLQNLDPEIRSAVRGDDHS